MIDDSAQPISRPELRQTILAQLHLLRSLKAVSRRNVSFTAKLSTKDDSWVVELLKLPEAWPLAADNKLLPDSEPSWWMRETQRRIGAVRHLAENFAPWVLPGYDSIRAIEKLELNACLRSSAQKLPLASTGGWSSGLTR